AGHVAATTPEETSCGCIRDEPPLTLSTRRQARQAQRNYLFKEGGPMRLEKKVAIVTAGGTGIGEAVATVFAREGATVAITGRRKEELERVVKDIERNGGHALALQGSVTNEADVREAVEATVRAYGHLDILVNNAGNLFYSGPLHETPDQVW